MNIPKAHHSLDNIDNDNILYQAIVDVPFSDKLHSTSLGLGIVVLLLADHENNALRRIALSQTEMAEGAIKYSVKPFQEIVIPLDYTENILVKAISTKQSQQTSDWAPMFTPELSAEEARLNQAGAGIACSIIYPLVTPIVVKPLGAMIFSYFEPLGSIGEEHRLFMEAYTETVAMKLVHYNANK
jgi:hypothetical protein